VLVLLGTFASRPWGELAAPRRSDIDTASGEISVFRQLTGQLGGGHAFGPPKSRAGRRVVPFPALLHTEVAPRVAPCGAQRRPKGVHFHDLRHTGNTPTADAGANLRELTERMGHSSTRAALVYLHSTSDRQRATADAVGTAAKAALGTQMAPKFPGDARPQRAFITAVKRSIERARWRAGLASMMRRPACDRASRSPEIRHLSWRCGPREHVKKP
jgi:hypothetical protein